MLNNIELKNQKNIKRGWLFAIYTIITMCVYILPALKIKVPYLLAGPLMLISLVIIAIKDDKMLRYASILLLISVYFLLVNLIKNMSIADSLNDLIRNVRYFLPVMWGIYCLKNVGKKQQKTILICFLIISGFMLYKTLSALEKEPWIARMLAEDQATSDAEVNQYRLENVGGYPFSYMIGAVLLIIFWISLSSKNFWIKLLCFATTILCYYYIIQTMYTTLLLLVSVGIVIITIVKIKNPLLKCVPIILFALALLYLPVVLKYVSGLFDSDSLLTKKFMQMYNAITGEGVEALGTRPELISKAIDNWLKSPIFGAINYTPSHSTIIEYLQQGGIVGFVLNLFMVVFSWKACVNVLRKKSIEATLFNIILMYMMVLSFFNDIRTCYEITIAVFFITMIVSVLFCKKKGVVNE